MSLIYSNTVALFGTKGIILSNSNEWLVACCDWFINDNPTASKNEVFKFVYEQWLLADLRDVGQPSIPAHSRKDHIKQKCALQVDSVVDIGNSCYSQLQKIRNKTTDDLEIGVKKDESWIPKSNRTLKLNCTDGVNTICGMEYKPIPALREPFIPGFKVLIIPPVEVRNNIMLLEERNIEILGGEVDSIIVQNATENILARKLHTEENPSPFGLTNSVPNISPRDTAQHVETILPAVRASNEMEEFDTFEEDDEAFLCNQIDLIENTYVLSSQRRQDNDTNKTLNEVKTSCTQTSNSMEMSDYHVSSISQQSETILQHTGGVKRTANSPISETEKLVKIIANDVTKDMEKIQIVYTESQSSVSSTNEYLSTNSKIEQVLLSPPSVPLIHIFVGYVVRLTSAPKIRREKWDVAAEISDNTGNLAVLFSDSFIEKVFEISALEMLSQKEALKTNPIIKEKVQKTLQDGRAKLEHLKGKFKTLFLPEFEVPEVIDVI